MTTTTSRFLVQVQFGDCDPAGIVFFPNFARWMDASSLHFFRTCGVPRWHQIDDPVGVVGTPVLEVRIRFLQSATYGEELQVHTSIEDWQAKVFVHRHRVMRGETLICEADETRAFCIRNAEGQLKAAPIPAWLRERCQ
ncbi:acyl-CoA thioesterase [Ideonella sp.]|uniref:acyl-CoA thioesterase n=1 Tax=Ideonella sp. TaxID=1929293 RepID=UPI003BB7943A